MLTTSASVALGLLFVLVGGLNVWLMLEGLSRGNRSARWLALHRIGGHLFVALFCVMTWFMITRLGGGAADSSPGVAIHLAIAMVLAPLLFLKVLIARYYRKQHGLLMPLGVAIFVLGFVLVASTAGPSLMRPSRMEQVSIDSTGSRSVAVDMIQAGSLTERRCSKCHNLDRVFGARKDARGWVTTVDHMRLIPNSGISRSDAQTIVAYLVSQTAPKDTGNAKMEVARALVDQRCGRCHTLDRVYQAVETPPRWREIVSRMAGYASGSAGEIRSDEEEQIVEYLSATQTPETAAQRRAPKNRADSPSRGPIANEIPVDTVPRSHFKARTIGFVSFVFLALLALVFRRPAARVTIPTAPMRPSTPALPPKPPGTPFLLDLVRITQQTPDSKTLRFAVRGGRKLDSRPGQFLTLYFLFDGKQETRCYSICSSPARSGYVEITPKRVRDGGVSAFLNDRAFLGLTVEASGPFGQFCLDVAADRRIVLVAAGSGITPMMAMLRYIDDLCTDTDATLLYCVRTSRDIIFRQELVELQARLNNFRYRVLLSQAEPEWTGARGHIDSSFMRESVGEIADQVFFLCGPPPFMELARKILLELGVHPAKIRQETFGAPTPAAARSGPQPAETAFVVEFARSGKTIEVQDGQTLLEAATGAGIKLPSACRQGQCGTCKTRLLEGSVEMDAEQGLDAQAKAEGFVLTCVGRATGKVKLDA